ncbi:MULTISPECIES: hypothetical protein [Winogradskyella]|uniref:hypothetical protein n=1 Tax=Winogradskyella TaxID=286104 RepID=UPI0015C9CE19|nr:MULTISPECIES: hypothetical protein [Winogradskyella]QXP79010.1 hypothetical protein H0I32_17725 [Winogradskyella sp. HaHa_3_26]
MTKSTCKLCKEKKSLIKKSHIISEFLHKEIFDENHKLIAFDPKELRKTNPSISRPSSGAYEGNLLCKKCDNEIIGKYESYVSKLLNKKLNKNEKIKCNIKHSKDKGTIIELSDLNYSSLKLFLLSLLWRAHISSRDEYQNVDLGPYANKIGQSILNENPGSDDDTIITISKLDPTAGFSNFIAQPIRYKLDNSTYYIIIINGYIIIYFLKENHLSKKIKHQRLKEDGTLEMVEIPKDKVSSLIMNYIGVTK